MRWMAVALGLVCACSGDAAPELADAAATADAAPVPPPSHLLLSEVYSQIAMWEFIEVINPTAVAVDLDDYYLADDAVYAELPTSPAIGDSDFVVGFPAGAAIEPGGVIVIARDGGGFAGTFGADADYAIANPGNATAMRAVLVGADAQLADTGEPVVLFRWDGASPRVDDVDIVLTGIPQAGNRLVDKATLGAGYAVDALTMPDFGDVTNDAQSYARVRLEELAEVATGGNGIGGHDETSEQVSQTWGTPLTFAAPTPGVAEPGLTPDP